MSNRRQFLKTAGLFGAAGVPLLSACVPKAKTVPKSEAPESTNPFANLKYDFYGKHQSGIVTPAQRHAYFLVVDLHSTDVNEVKQMFKNWTQFSAKLMAGENIKPYDTNPHLPPSDTGESDSLGAYGLTLTFGVSPSFFDKLGLSDKKPPEFSDLPKFPRDQLKPQLTGGDICIQACSEDPQVAFHAVRQLVRQARSLITMKWSQSGYNAFDGAADTPRNLFAFKDGTANKQTLQNPEKWLWIDQGPFKNGSYLVTRIIQMHLETWDRTSLLGQEDTFGRHRESGASIGETDEFAPLDIQATDDQGNHIVGDASHAGIANRTGLKLLRRSYSYSSGIDDKGQFNAGLLFISFQKNPMQFSVIQNAFGNNDKMTEYTTHIGSGLFLCFGGVEQGGYLGQALFE
ncbi:iron uptake transporter deferrochelatase/peroxidase subunit [Moraxella oculi]|uniref:Deferrochelatase n=1 Tax=Moraxella oculi TaxID=2940516 RepID=A0ABW8U6I2_9GAMM